MYPTIEYATDTTRTIASLVFSGTAARYPDIRWIFSHGGGTMPFLLSRFAHEERTVKNRDQCLPKGVVHELQKFYYDTVQANHPGAPESGARYSALMPVDLATAVHLASSVATVCASSSDVLPTGSAASASRRSRVSGSFAIRIISS